MMPNHNFIPSASLKAAAPESEKDNLRDIATYLFGDEWREGTASALKTDRRAFVRELASDEPLRKEIWLALSQIAEKRLENVWREHAEILDLIREHLKSQDATASRQAARGRRSGTSTRTVKSADSKD